jgi:NADPH:quinone reductase-like Zn-dependent oxidoreductase
VTHMRAIVHTRYGGPDVLHLEERERPVPAADEVLVRVHAATVNRTDCGFRSGSPWISRYFSGWRRPKLPILGTEFAGEVVETGADVTQFAVGDRVFGVNANHFGTHAEYVAVREAGPIATIPEGIADDEAAAVCDGVVLARTNLRAAGVTEDTRLLVYGASGSIGTAGVQLAKHLGADVTAVCDTARVDLVRSLGADRVIDYTREDFTVEGIRYDVIFDAVGKLSFRHVRPALRPDGVYSTTDLGYLWQVPPLAIATRYVGRQRVMLPIPAYRKDDVLLVRELMAAGAYRAVIDSTYSLDDIVAATRYVEGGQKTGNVVIRVAGA